jgi:Spy/CpxP family protein refolding chaperone
MKMLKKIALVGSGILLAFSMNAQTDQAPKERKSPEERQAKRIEKVKAKLELTDEQTAQWEAISAKHKAERDQAHANNEVKKQAKRAEIDAIRTKQEAELAATLTPEQLIKWEELKAQREQKMQERKEQHGKIGPK